jgi:uncharacterized glyoxalase superfamily protein PhnB/predicted enzyme related to lactoylglutathione lyase
MTDAFDALVADTTPIEPARRFADDLRRRIVSALEEPMPTTSPPRSIGVRPYLSVAGAAAAIDFYVAAFGAVEHHRLVGDDGRVGHAEITIGTTRLRLADEYPEYGITGPISRGGSPVTFTIELADPADVDTMFRHALELGATEARPVEDQFYGHRQGTLADPFGYEWSISAPIAGFDDEQYAANSAAQGFTLVPAGDPNPAETEHRAPGHQVKPHGAGDLFYFTLPTTDLTRAQAFFGAVLGWQFRSTDNGHVENIAAPPGGLNVVDEPGARLWFVVDDIHAAVARVRELGGTATDPVQYDSGWSSDCTDDQGTSFSLSVPAAKYTQ